MSVLPPRADIGRRIDARIIWPLVLLVRALIRVWGFERSHHAGAFCVSANQPPLWRLFLWRNEMNLDFAQLRSRSELAKLLGISVDTLKAMEKRGEAPERVQVSPKIVGYTQEAIAKFLASRTVTSEVA
jgi:predicted DNA-binding transcriptional regulator AlpA